MPHAPPNLAYPFRSGLGELVLTPMTTLNSQVSTYLAPICGSLEIRLDHVLFGGTYPIPQPRSPENGLRYQVLGSQESRYSPHEDWGGIQDTT